MNRNPYATTSHSKDAVIDKFFNLSEIQNQLSSINIDYTKSRDRLPPPSRSSITEPNRESDTHGINQPERTLTERVVEERARPADGLQATPTSRRNESDDE